MKFHFILQIIRGTIKLIIPTFNYIIYFFKNPKIGKFFIPWLFSNLNPHKNNIKDKTIWITFESKMWLEKFLKPNMTIFEYGSGGSTIFFTNRVKNLISVEHDMDWHKNIKKILEKNEIKNCEYILSKPQKINDIENQNFSDYKKFLSEEYPNFSFESYVKNIDKFQDQNFDLIFIDGRSRPACIFHSLNKVKRGGIIMLDNSERAHYQLGKKLLSNWLKIDFYGPGPYGRFFWNTTIWQRSKN